MRSPLANWILAALALLQAGCVSGDEGLECLLIKAADGGAAALVEAEVPRGKDVVSYGAPECGRPFCSARDARRDMAVGALLEHPDRIRVRRTTSVHPAWAAWFPLGLAPGAGRPCVRPNIRPRARAAA